MQENFLSVGVSFQNTVTHTYAHTNSEGYLPMLLTTQSIIKHYYIKAIG